jgi:hypothetical protein
MAIVDPAFPATAHGQDGHSCRPPETAAPARAATQERRAALPRSVLIRTLSEIEELLVEARYKAGYAEGGRDYAIQYLAEKQELVREARTEVERLEGLTAELQSSLDRAEA